jgi:hypothetical protein
MEPVTATLVTLALTIAVLVLGIANNITSIVVNCNKARQPDK